MVCVKKTGSVGKVLAVSCVAGAALSLVWVGVGVIASHAKIDLLTAASAVAGETARNLEKTRRRRRDFTIFFRLASSAASSCPQCA